jgi:hypothetical protein
MGVTAEDLQKLNCAECEDEHNSCVLVLSPNCHKAGPTFVSFHKATNSLTVVCAECKKLVVEIDLPRMI